MMSAIWTDLNSAKVINKPPFGSIKVPKKYRESGGIQNTASANRCLACHHQCHLTGFHMLSASGDPFDEANFSAVPGGYTAIRFQVSRP
jgi:nitrate reductase cytochrome c-type subunit